VLSVIQLAGASSSPLCSLVANSSNPAVLSFSTFPDIVDGVVLFHGVAIGDGIADLEVSDHRNGALIDRIALQVKTADDVSPGEKTPANLVMQRVGNEMAWKGWRRGALTWCCFSRRLRSSGLADEVLRDLSLDVQAVLLLVVPV
jgi:hypothetical protein